MKKKKSSTGTISNKRAKFDYDLSDSFVVGIVLNGRETKNLRMGHGQLRGAYVTIKDDELWLINASITGSRGIPIEESEVTQARKLLAKRKEIDQIIAAKKQGKTVLPTDILTRGRFIKIRIALGTGKKQYDKRQTMKKRDDDRNAAREVRRSLSPLIETGVASKIIEASFYEIRVPTCSPLTIFINPSGSRRL